MLWSLEIAAMLPGMTCDILAMHYTPQLLLPSRQVCVSDRRLLDVLARGAAVP